MQSPATIRNPAVATLMALAIAALAAAAALVPRRAFAATLVASALPVVTVAAALYPAVLASALDPGATLTVPGAVAGGGALRLLTFGAAPQLPALVAVQAACWWLFRRRDRVPTLNYW